MKRFLSLFIALILVFSMFAVTTVAFAANADDNTDGKSESRVSVNWTEFENYVFNDYIKTIEMSKEFMFDGKVTVGEGDQAEEVVWYENSEILHKIFKGINYIELKDEKGVLGKDDEGYEDAQKFSVIYDLKLTEVEEPDSNEETANVAEDDDDTENDVAKYQVTEHVKLDKAPTQKGFKFAGWKISFDDLDEETTPNEYLKYIFPAGFEFNMPKSNVTVTAVWKQDAVKDDDTTDDSSATEAEDEVEIPDLYANDIVYVLCTTGDPRKDMKDWEKYKVSEEKFSVRSNENEWNFRFAVADGIRTNEEDYEFDWDADILATTFDNIQQYLDKNDEEGALNQKDYTLRCTAIDTTAPEIKLSKTMKNKMEDGLTSGVSYTISTALDINDASDTTTTYKVYKKVGTSATGADKDGWVLIYDSSKTTDKVTEGYEDYISSSGVITPVAKDITGDYIYKIVYSVVDKEGNVGVHVDSDYSDSELPENPTLLLKVNAPVVQPKTPNAIEAWKIVLYVVAGLSAVGIVVLLCIKPKKAEAVDGRYNASAKDETEGGSNNDGEQNND